MDELRHSALITRLDTIVQFVHFDWHLFLLALGVALWCGLGIGPAIVTAWLVEFFGSVLLNVIVGVYRSVLMRKK